MSRSNFNTRSPMPNSSFADRKNRMFPIIDEHYVRGAWVAFSNLYLNGDKTKKYPIDKPVLRTEEEIQRLHNIILKASKNFQIHHQSCEWCMERKEKVEFT